MHRTLASLVLSCLALILPLGAQSGNVLVVDESGGPGSGFTTLSAAIAAASEGDLLLLRDGTYSGSISGKSLFLQAENPFGAHIDSLSITGLAADQPVTVRGCWCTFLAFSNSLGTIRLEESSSETLGSSSCQDLVLRGVSISPFPFFSNTCWGGIDASGSNLYIYDSTIRGMYGQEGLGLPWCEPEAGIKLDGSSLYLHGSTVTGGAMDEFACPAPGIEAIGQSPVEITNCQVSAGRGSGCGPIPSITGTTPMYRPGTARRVSSPSPVLEGQMTSVTYDGDPGDFVWLATSPTPSQARYYPLAGTFHALLSVTKVVPVGLLPGSGTLTHTFPVPTYADPLLVRSLYLQAYFVSPSNERQLGAPTHLHILDPSY